MNPLTSTWSIPPVELELPLNILPWALTRNHTDPLFPIASFPNPLFCLLYIYKFRSVLKDLPLLEDLPSVHPLSANDDFLFSENLRYWNIMFFQRNIVPRLTLESKRNHLAIIIGQIPIIITATETDPIPSW